VRAGIGVLLVVMRAGDEAGVFRVA
jgi:hypothetical protein